MPAAGLKRILESAWREVASLGIGARIVVVVLFALLGAAIVGVYFSGAMDVDADVSGPGYVAMALGVIFTLAVGFGLMALIFYSSRKGYDEPPTVDPTDPKRDG